MERHVLINALIQISAAKSYLEIGVQRGVTFKQVRAPFKVAVDPKFLFEPIAVPGVEEYYPCSSNEFFEKNGESEFDVVFIDGLHTFEQSLRDLVNALTICHKRSLIVLDDTMPLDWAASLPKMKDSFFVRTERGEENRSWMGDVYKTVAFVSEFMPTLHYATIRGGHGMTVMWQGSRRKIQKGWTISEIAGADYLWFLSNKSVMNVMTLDQICESLRIRFPVTADSVAGSAEA